MSGLCDNCSEWSAVLLNGGLHVGWICSDCKQRQADGPMGEDSEPDFNAESGRERQIKEYYQKYD